MAARTSERGKIVPVKDRERETAAEANGPVKTFKMTPEELEDYRARTGYKGPTTQDGKTIQPPVQGNSVRGGRPTSAVEPDKSVFLRSIAEGNTIAATEKAMGLKPNSIYQWLKKWELTGIKQEKAREMLGIGRTEQEPIAEPQQPEADTPRPIAAIDQLRAEVESWKAKAQEAGALTGKVTERHMAEIDRLKETLDATSEGYVQQVNLVTELINKNTSLQVEIDRLNLDNAELISSEVLVAEDPSVLTLQFELHDYGADLITQRLKVHEELGEFADEVEAANIDFNRAMSEAFDVVQALTGLIRTQLKEFMVEDVNGTIQRYFTHHNKLHIQKLRQRLVSNDGSEQAVAN